VNRLLRNITLCSLKSHHFPTFQIHPKFIKIPPVLPPSSAPGEIVSGALFFALLIINNKLLYIVSNHPGECGLNEKWIVKAKDESIEKQYSKDFTSGKISYDDNKAIRRWFNIVEQFGPQVLYKNNYWNDHPLDGKWAGYRSSSFSKRGRIIYKVNGKIVTVVVFKITPDHNYAKD